MSKEGILIPPGIQLTCRTARAVGSAVCHAGSACAADGGCSSSLVLVGLRDPNWRPIHAADWFEMGGQPDLAVPVLPRRERV